MKKNLLKTGMLLKSALGELCEVTAADNDIAVEVTVLDQNSQKTEKKYLISELNEDCFSFVDKGTAEYDVPVGYVVSNGEIVGPDGAVVRTGYTFEDGFCVAVPGKIFVASIVDDATAVIMAYRPMTDLFENSRIHVDRRIFATSPVQNEEIAAYSFSATKEVENEIVFDGAAVLVVGKKRVGYLPVEAPCEVRFLVGNNAFIEISSVVGDGGTITPMAGVEYQAVSDLRIGEFFRLDEKAEKVYINPSTHAVTFACKTTTYVYTNSESCKLKVGASTLGDHLLLAKENTNANVSTLMFANPDLTSVVKIRIEKTADRGVLYSVV